MERQDFRFHDSGRLVDGDLELHLAERCPADPEKGLVPEYKFEMRRHGEDEGIGRIYLRIWLSPKLQKHGGHIGYEVNEAYRGRRYAARSCRLLFPLAKKHGIDLLLITCAEDNAASRRTCELIGGELQRIDTIDIGQGVMRPTCYYHVKTT